VGDVGGYGRSGAMAEEGEGPGWRLRARFGGRILLQSRLELGERVM